MDIGQEYVAGYRLHLAEKYGLSANASWDAINATSAAQKPAPNNEAARRRAEFRFIFGFEQGGIK